MARRTALPLICLIVSLNVTADDRPQLDPVVASDRTNFAVAWAEGYADPRSLVTRRLSPAGDPIDATAADTGSVTAEAHSEGSATFPSYAIAFGAGRYLVVWSDPVSIVGRYMSASGVLEGPAVILRTPARSPAIVWTGSSYFLVWAEGDAVMGAFVNDDLTLSEPHVIARSPSGMGQVRVAWDGERFLVVWQHFQLADPFGSGWFWINVARVSAAGEAIDSTPLYQLINPRHVTVASGSRGTFLLVFDSYGRSVVGGLVHTAGETIQAEDPFVIFKWFREPSSVVTWDGEAYLVASRYGVDYPWTPITTPYWLASTRVSENGKILSRSLVATRASSILSPPAIATNDAGESLIAISELNDSGATVVTAYAASRMPPAPAPPPAPENVLIVGNTLVWSSTSEGVDGFIIEDAYYADMYYGYTLAVVGSSDRSTPLPRNVYRVGRNVRLRAFNAGGLSSPVLATTARRRAAHP